MLTDLSFLTTGREFPPECEKERIELYYKNKELFESEHAEVYEKALERIQRVIGNFENVISYPIVFNFQQLITIKTADLLLGEPPEITAGEDKIKQVAIDLIVKNSDLMEVCYMAAIDVSRFGDGLFFIYNSDGKPIVDITQPAIWFPIVSPDNVRKVTQHVLAWCIGDKDNKQLKVQVHDKGSYEQSIYKMVNGKIGGFIESKVFQTGLSDFAVIPASNIKTSDRVFGYDDYTKIDSNVSELMVRVGQVARILDKHASPGMYGPSSVLDIDPLTGLAKFKADNFFVVESKDDMIPGYLTWEGQLAANFTQIDFLLKRIYATSEMGGAILGDLLSGGSITSAEQLKLTMNTALVKVARIRTRFDRALKKAIALCSELGGVKLTEDDISINWFDGLPADDKLLAETMQIRTGGKATISQLSAIKILDDTGEEGADLELSKILDDEMMAAPLAAPPMANQPEGTTLDKGVNDEN